MSALFQELDYRETPIGALSLRRRRDLKTGKDIYEIKLGEEFLMSSMFTASEIALANLALAKLDGDKLDIVVGGLGLGYTAQAVLASDHVGELIVVDALEAVIDWHMRGLLPLGRELSRDPRCRFIHADFFARSASAEGFDPEASNRKFDAILVDIDHSPEALLNPGNASLYNLEGLTALKTHLKPGGVFGLWSNDRPDERFTARLEEVFHSAQADPVTFDNPLQNNTFTQTVYLARKSPG